MARSLQDVLRRRVPLLLVQPPAREEIERVAQLVGAELGWDAARLAAEVDEVDAQARARCAR